MRAPAGLLLAAGAGRRMGRPKALVELDGIPLVRRALGVLRDGGCSPLLVVAGAAADDVARVVGDDALLVTAPDWSDGMGASLRAGLAALAGLVAVDAAVVHLVDLPGVGSEAVARLAALVGEVSGSEAPGSEAPGSEAPGSEAPGSEAAHVGSSDLLARAAYRGVPGHPVLLGRAHWAAVAAGAVGDAGARGYLAGHPGLRLVECADVADPRDVDTPEELRGTGAGGPLGR